MIYSLFAKYIIFIYHCGQTLGHSGFIIDLHGTRVLIDPFLNHPLTPARADQLDADYIILTHGHGDHSSNTLEIAQRTGATVISNFEVANWLDAQGLTKTAGHNPGGGYRYPFGRVELTPAIHSSSMPDGSYGGVACGVIIFAEGMTIYHSGDTALFSDMQLLGDKGLDVAILPIGDYFTMGPADSVKAVQYLRPRYVLPAHYNTFPPIQQDAAAWAKAIHQQTKAMPIVLDPGGTHEF
jgi:L-ascorbate metabolism protein UlaG (beta-lactamase superfamily)